MDERIGYARTVHAADMIDALGQAFYDDPCLAWIWPDRPDRLARLPFFFAPIVHGAIANGIALHSPGSNAVALWRQPGGISPDAAEMAPWQAHMARAFSSGAARSQLLGEVLRAHQPRDFDWWYLQFIGVVPAAQKTGLGGAAIRAGTALASAQAMPVYVEVMNPANLGYYRHAGFRVVQQFDIPDGGPHVWAMLWEAPPV